MSTLKVNTLIEATSGGATYYFDKAWVNFEGDGTVGILGSGNVGSITDNAVGLYTVNYTNSMSNNDYATTGTAAGSYQGTSGTNGRCGIVSPNLNATYSTTAVQIITKDSADGNIDSTKISISIIG
jgi:hypothetical protein